MIIKDKDLPIEINWTEKIQKLEEEQQKHKDAIRYLLSTNKQFQNEIQKKTFKTEKQKAPE